MKKYQKPSIMIFRAQVQQPLVSSLPVNTDTSTEYDNGSALSKPQTDSWDSDNSVWESWD